MQETIANLLKSVDGTLVVIILVIGCMNVLTTAAIKVLDRFKDKTAAEWDNKLAASLGKVAGLLSKVLQFCSANSTALPPHAREELVKATAEQVLSQAPVANPELGVKQGE